MSVAGFFDVTMQTPLGEKFATFSFIVDGSKLSGQLITTKDAVPLTGTTIGNNVDFTTEIVTSVGKISAHIIGQIDGDNFHAEAKIMFGKLTIVGTRRI